MAYQQSAGTVVLALPVIVILSLGHLFKKQNERIKAFKCMLSNGSSNGEQKGVCSGKIAAELEEETKNHLALSLALASINKVFEVNRILVPSNVGYLVQFRSIPLHVSSYWFHDWSPLPGTSKGQSIAVFGPA